VISYAVWLCYRFPLSLRMGEELLAARGIELAYLRDYATLVRKVRAGRCPTHTRDCARRGDKWQLDEVVVTINGRKHWPWRTVNQHSAVLDALMQSRRDRHAAKRLMRKLLRKHRRAPRVLITDKLTS
jgi:putative transposase